MFPHQSSSSAAARAHLGNRLPLSLPSPDYVVNPPVVLARVRLPDITPYDGAPAGQYLRAVEALSGSLTRHNAAIIELGNEDAAIMRCGLEATRSFFKVRAQVGSGRGFYTYRAGRLSGDWDSSPPCMAEIFRSMGKVARATLSAIAKHLRLRSNVFDHLLDDTPLPANEISSSVLVAAYSQASSQTSKGTTGMRFAVNGEVEKGLLMLISSECPGLQVCDPNGRWFLADGVSGPGDLLLITGKALSHATAGLRPAASYRTSPECSPSNNTGGRSSLLFKLMPQGNAILDCSPITAAGHVIPQSYVPISVSQFMDDLCANDNVACNQPDNIHIAQPTMTKEPSLRSVLSDPLSGAFLEDAVVVSCGHSFGGLMLGRVLEMSRCSICNEEIESASLVPNIALRAAAKVVKDEDERRLFHNAAVRKRRKELGDQLDLIKYPNRENGKMAGDDGPDRGVQYPFAVNEKVLIEGNRRTPEKFVGKEAIIISQCLNGWYLLKVIGTGESVRLQYRSLRKKLNSRTTDDTGAAGHLIGSSTS